MPRSSNQKLKHLYLARLLLESTDENNTMTAERIVSALAAYDIPAGRKSVYDDIEALQRFGLDVEHRGGKDGGYFIASRDFELPELKLLVDAVQSSRLITEKKSRELIKKLSKLTSAAQAKQLNRQVYAGGRAKALNETVYYSIDAIHAAINDGKKISFKYFDYNIRKRRVFRRNGEAYIRTPVAMCWNDDNYYLVTYSPRHDDHFATYRVDRMAQATAMDEDADEYDRKAFSIAEYVKQTFGMFSGTTETARLAFDASLVGVVLDHFGSSTSLTDIGDGRFSVSAEVSSSPVFLGWVFQLGEKAEIIEPESLRAAMREFAGKVRGIYEK
jgi:predicted DNA-binding transcriptional regulator YafY